MYSIEALQEILIAEIYSRLEKLKECKPSELYQPVEYALEHWAGKDCAR